MACCRGRRPRARLHAPSHLRSPEQSCEGDPRKDGMAVAEWRNDPYTLDRTPARARRRIGLDEVPGPQLHLFDEKEARC